MIGLVINNLEINLDLLSNLLGCIILHRAHFKTNAILGAVETIGGVVLHLIQISKDQIFLQGFKIRFLETNDNRFMTHLIVGFDLNVLHFGLHLLVVLEGQIHPHLAVVLEGKMNLHHLGMIDLTGVVLDLTDLNSLHSNLL